MQGVCLPASVSVCNFGHPPTSAVSKLHSLLLWRSPQLSEATSFRTGRLQREGEITEIAPPRYVTHSFDYPFISTFLYGVLSTFFLYFLVDPSSGCSSTTRNSRWSHIGSNDIWICNSQASCHFIKFPCLHLWVSFVVLLIIHKSTCLKTLVYNEIEPRESSSVLELFPLFLLLLILHSAFLILSQQTIICHNIWFGQTIICHKPWWLAKPNREFIASGLILSTKLCFDFVLWEWA